jgi:uncharacterized membrane protein
LFGKSLIAEPWPEGGRAMLYGLALLAGVAAGLRAFTPLAAVSWSAATMRLALGGTWLEFMGYSWLRWILTVLALIEYVLDQLPSTPSRKVPMQFGARLVSGALCGACLGAAESWIAGLVTGVIGAVIGTYGGAFARTRMAKAFGSDPPAALIEDAVAVILGVTLVFALP